MTFVPTLAALFAATLAPKPTGQVQPGGLPDYSNRFARTAVKALRGDYGKLHDWQREGYQRGLTQGSTTTQVFVLTQYNAREGRSGRVDSKGNPCTWRTAASNKIKRGKYIWTEITGMRQILDCGASSNDYCEEFRKALSRAGFTSGKWVDIWFPTARAARRAGLTGWSPARGAIIER